jgi:aminopeptidase-like protein
MDELNAKVRPPKPLTGSRGALSMESFTARKSNALGTGKRMRDQLVALWPLHRTINCDDMERALEMCGAFVEDLSADGVEFQMQRFKPLEDAYTWWIPERYKVNEAWLEINGERIADFQENSLHLLSYSVPTTVDGRLGDIRDHIWSREKNPDAIPWEFKYYDRSWGFCVRHNDLIRFDDDAKVEGVIDVEFGDGDFCLAELFLPGETDDEMLFLTNICHPMQVNDSLSGLVVALGMIRELAKRKNRRHGLRVLIVPETIGTMAWLSRNEDVAARAKFAWFCEICGHDNSFVLQHSRQETEALIDRTFLAVMRDHERHGNGRTGEFRKLVASDEMITNGPGWDLPTPSLTRWPYDEYHTSDDNPDIISEDNLEETLNVFIDLWDALENNYYPRRTFIGPVMLSRYGLWVDWRDHRALNLAIDDLMCLLDGDLSVIDIAHQLSLPASAVFFYLDQFFEAGLIEKSSTPWTESARFVGQSD